MEIRLVAAGKKNKFIIHKTEKNSPENNNGRAVHKIKIVLGH